MKKIKNTDIKLFVDGVSRLIQIPLPTKISFAIFNNLQICEPIVANIINDTKEITNKYSIKDNNGKPIISDNKIMLSSETDFLKEILELDNKEIDIDLQMISINDLSAIDTLSVKEIASLQIMIERDK